MTEARALLRSSAIGCLATLQNQSGSPFASLITIATAADGAPFFLISALAWHTKNLLNDSRASILIAEAAASGDPLNVGRLSLIGVAEQTGAPLARRRFLARHPSASHYAGFADFSFWRLAVETAHYVGGFGRIATIPGGDLLLGGDEARRWDEDLDKALADVNERHVTLIERIALARRPGLGGAWRIAACDQLGCDMVMGANSLRIAFPAPLTAPEAVADALAALVLA